MYHPVLHARQSERLAVVRIEAKLKSADNVRPVTIPVKDNKVGDGSGARNCQLMITQFSRKKIPHYLLVTPYVKNMPYNQVEILAWRNELDENQMSIPLVAVTQNKPVSTLKAEIQLLGTETFGLLHVAECADDARLVALCATYKTQLVAPSIRFPESP